MTENKPLLNPPADLMQAILLVLCDREPESVDAVFVHGAAVRDDELDAFVLDEALEHFRDHDCPIVLNGTSVAKCAEKTIAYIGLEEWQRSLEEMGVHTDHILNIGEALNTPAEYRQLLAMAQKNGWKNIVAVSLPHHITRCAMTLVTILEEMNIDDIKVYFQAPRHVDWQKMTRKPVLGGTTVIGGGEEQGTLIDLARGEADRIEKYSAEPPKDDKGAPKYTRNVTAAELFEYFKRRDAVVAAEPEKAAESAEPEPAAAAA